MKAGKNKELDYLLINLCEQPRPNDQTDARQYRDKHSLAREPWTWTGTEEYHHFGPGVSLYFTLLKYLILLFGVLVLISLPSLLVNLNGKGLDIYGSSISKGLMTTSLANQPILQFQKGELNLTSQSQKINVLKGNQMVLIFDDVVCSIVIICFLIFWRLKSEDLISEMVKKQALPSYHTIVVTLPSDLISQEGIRAHFQQFGTVRQVQFVYDYGSFLLETKQLMELVQRYNEQ